MTSVHLTTKDFGSQSRADCRGGLSMCSKASTQAKRLWPGWRPASLLLLLFNACTRVAVPVEHDDEQAHEHQENECAKPLQAVKLALKAQERAGITLAKAEGVPARTSAILPAEVQADPARVAHVSALVSGQLTQVKAMVGSRVRAGDVLAILRSIELGQARSALARAQANLEAARANFRRQEDLQKENIGSRRAFIEAQAQLRREEAELMAAQRSLAVYGKGGSGSDIPIRAPIDAVVVAGHATVGEVVHPSDELFELTDVQKVWAIGRSGQKQASVAQIGAPATFYVEGINDRNWSGHIDYVAPSLDPTTRTVQVRVILDNADGALRAGMFGELSLGRPSDRDDGPLQAQIDAQAVQRLDGQDYVFVPGSDAETFRAVPISTTQAIHHRVQVLTGLQIGDTYVSNGSFVLKSEALRAQLQSDHH